MFYKTLLCSAILLPVFYASAQDAFTTTGGNATGNGGSVSYSVGQVAYITNKSSSGSVNQGVQQPYEVFITSNKDKTSEVQPGISVFPNPSQKFLLLKIENFETGNFSYTLNDEQGRLIGHAKVTTAETNLPLNDKASGIYFLAVYSNGSEVKTFKLLKN